MSRYDDDGIEFAQQTFESARAYRESQAKKQDRFAKRLQMANLAVTGLNFAINKKADELELAQAPKRAAYLSTLESAKSFRAGEDERKKSGHSVEGYLTNKYYEQIKQEIEKMSPNAVASEYQPIAMEKAKEFALASKADYEKILNLSNKLNFEDFEEYYQQSAKIPRSIGGWFGSKVKNFMKGETKETIKLRNEDALAGTTMGDAFKDADVALRAYDAHTDLGNVAIDIAKNLTRGARTEGKIKEMIGSEGYGLYYIQQEADPLGKKPPKIITTKIGGIYNKEGELSFTQKLDFLKLIKDDKELQNEIQQAFKDDPTGTKALDIASSDPQKYYKIDFDDEIKREELFELRYQSMASTRPDLFILRDGKYVARTGQKELIAELKLDRDNLRLEFNQRIEDGLKLGQGELDTVGLNSVFTLVPDDQKENYTNLFMGDDSEFIKIFGQQIAESDASAVNLGTHDLSIIFPNMGLTGTYELIWDNNSKNLLFK